MAMIHVHEPTILLYVFFMLFPMAISVTDSEALLKLRESFGNVSSLDSWKPNTDACAEGWSGVFCNKGRVNGLNLNFLGLSGKIDIDALVDIPGLRSISLMSNGFSGPMPEINRLGALKGLYLSDNKFSGEIPQDYFTKMASLKKIWLSGNVFAGKIPSSLGELPHLLELHLENNQFSGKIPPLSQPTLMSLNLSNNNLQGEIPIGLSRFNASSFQGNAELCGAPLDVSCEGLKKDSFGNHKPNVGVSVGLLVASAAILLLMVVGIQMMRQRQEDFVLIEKENLDESLVGMRVSSSHKKDIDSSRKGFGSSQRGSSRGKRVGDLVLINEETCEFGLADLMKAAAEVLGNGTLGSCYKAVMANGFSVVVKRTKEMNKLGKDQFDNEMRRLGGLKHINVLTPLAYHYRKDEKLLIHEYVPKGSLLYLLHGDRGASHAELSWPVRLKIVQGIARGLGYLHTELAALDLPHGNLKSSNVLLSPKYEPLLTDYGLTTLLSGSQALHTLMAYRCPEAVLNQQVSPKCDVYCLGIIIIEILTGKFPSQYLNHGKGGTDIVQWVKTAVAEGREAELYDPDIANNKESLVEIQKLIHIAAACTESNPAQRLDLKEAISRIEGVLVEGPPETKTIQVLPSLRDGYADAPTSQNQTRRYESIGDRSGRASFAFDIS